MKINQALAASVSFVLVACNAGKMPTAVADDAIVKYEVDQAHTRILWEGVTGSGIFLGFFNGATGKINFDPENPENSSVSIAIHMDRLMTGVERLDNHLRSDEFFDAEQFPEATFNSTAIDVTGEDTALITGDFTFHGVTKPVTIDTKFRNHVDFGTSERIAFSGATVIKRSEYGVSHMDDWIEDDVKIRIELEGARRKAAPEEGSE